MTLIERAARPAGALVLLHSWWGLTDHFRQLAAELAGAGLTTVAPDLYGGPSTDDPVRARELRRGLDDEDTLARVAAAVGAAQELAGGAPAGVLGFSVGAEFAIRAAARLGPAAGAVVAFYGTYLPDDLPALTAPVQLHLATDDEFVPPEEAAEFAGRMVALAKRLELYTYPGTRHAFVNRSRPEAYDPAAAELGRRRAVAFLRDTLHTAVRAAPAAHPEQARRT
ncbi:MAG TPA: alpha/beta fold hydrolase [Mycobacteriales bacterium]|nr:alpha/beta fold hydrolase [Mycobacteriales bacterium]